MSKTSQALSDYIESADKQAQPHLKKMRALVRKAAPGSEETIKWGMPTFMLGGNLVHFAWHKRHLGFYPGSEAIVAFKKELTAFVSSKGAVQFPYDKPIPATLITKIVKSRVKTVLAKLAARKEKKRRPSA